MSGCPGVQAIIQGLGTEAVPLFASSQGVRTSTFVRIPGGFVSIISSAFAIVLARGQWAASVPGQVPIRLIIRAIHIFPASSTLRSTFSARRGYFLSRCVAIDEASMSDVAGH